MKQNISPTMQQALRSMRLTEQKDASRSGEKTQIEIAKAALHRIINRSNTGAPGSSQVADMRRIAEDALKDIG